jgi:hypothetical protein
VGDGSVERTHQATKLGLAADEQVARVGGHRQAGDVPRVFGAFGADIVHLTHPALVHYPTTRAPSATPEDTAATKPRRAIRVPGGG